MVHTGHTARIDESLAESPGAKMFANRIAKNIKQLEKWAEREQVSCYRLYDADMPEYSFAIDRYAEAGREQIWLYVQEYAAPKTIEPEAAAAPPQRGAGGAARRHGHSGRVASTCASGAGPRAANSTRS